MWNILLCLIGASIMIVALNTIVYDILPNQDYRYRCTPKYRAAKEVSDNAAYTHNIIKIIFGIFVIIFGVAKSVISHGGDPAGLWTAVKVSFNSSLIGTAIDLATSIYFTIKYKLLLVKDTLNTEVTKKVAMKSANTDAHLSSDIQVFKSVSRVQEQYWEIGFAALLLMIFGIAIY